MRKCSIRTICSNPSPLATIPATTAPGSKPVSGVLGSSESARERSSGAACATTRLMMFPQTSCRRAGESEGEGPAQHRVHLATDANRVRDVEVEARWAIDLEALLDDNPAAKADTAKVRRECGVGAPGCRVFA